ncbi:hypothetical protein SAMN05428961_102513 [Paenibacillus sp. OK060]|nr:hypothetical protein SAMN05428961_102513 [Paenibacillus sp. OK060]
MFLLILRSNKYKEAILAGHSPERIAFFKLPCKESNESNESKRIE